MYRPLRSLMQLGSNAARTRALCRVLLPLSVLLRCAAEPLPEPGLILYGVVSNSSSAQRIVLGTLEWTIQPQSGGPALKVSANLTNLGDQFSYVLELPFETRKVGGQFLGASAGTLEVASVPTTFNRATVTLDGKPVTLANPTQRTFTFGPADRGRMERVDLVVSSADADTDGDGLSDAWERTFFGNLARDGTGDADGDGLTDLDEFIAGTTPTDAGSAFQFIDIKRDDTGAVTVRWSSIAGRIYTLERSGDLRGGFAPVISGIIATPPENAFTNARVNSPDQNFYRLRVQR